MARVKNGFRGTDRERERVDGWRERERDRGEREREKDESSDPGGREYDLGGGHLIANILGRSAVTHLDVSQVMMLELHLIHTAEGTRKGGVFLGLARDTHHCTQHRQKVGT